MLATRVVARLQEAFPVVLSLREFFERPKVASLAEYIETALKEGQGQQRIPPIEKAPREGRLPLSFAQQRLWFLNQLEPDNAAYNISAGVRVRGLLNYSALDKTINTIVERHEVLRTIFQQVDGKPAQIITAKQVLSLPVVNLEELPQSEVEAAVQRLAAEEAGAAFDLTRGPLLRVTLLRVSEQEHIVLLTAHHIVSDGWSMGVLIGEVASLYEAFASGQPSPLPALPVQYADYAHWQREWLRDETLEAHLSYWREKLEGQPPVLSLPADRQRPAVQTFRGARLSRQLPRSLAAGLKQLCDRHGATMFMALLAAFKVLLCRYTQQTDIVVGTPIANRGSRQLETLIGFFANTLVLRTDLSGDPTFQELLARVRETALGAYAHQDVPFERLVGELQVARDLSHTPLFQVMFTLQNAPAPERKSSNLALSLIETEGSTAKFDLELLIAERDGGLAVTWEYNTDLFERVTIEAMAGHFQNLLSGAVLNPLQPISALPLLTDAERHQLLAGWNDTRAEVDFDRCAHQLFEEQAERTPDALAVVCAEERLTYAELNARANRLAKVLVERGVGPDVLVAILSARDTNLLTAILAVFKAGGAYLPLDPLHPSARLEQVLRQSRSQLLLTAEEFKTVLSTALDGLKERAPEVFLIEDLLRREGRPAANLPARSGGSNLAYVIYTSGSTGVPKGAMVEHRGMLNHLYAKIKDLQLTARDRIAQTASQCFDISVWQLLSALFVGGTVHIYPDEIAHDGPRLLEETGRDSVSILETVPSLLRASLDEAARGGALPALSSLKYMIVTGEALPPELCRQWLKLYPRIPLLNAYGPTECSDDVTHHRLEHPPSEEVIHIPIGRPIINMSMYVLDSRLQPVPRGVSGGLYVGGVGVGRGYLNDAARTAEVFIPDPLSGAPGARLYATGDVGRYLPDGQIEFLGRSDHQVKLRGFRIELGEIEAALRELPAVREAVVIVREDGSEARRLVAYVVATERELEAQHASEWRMRLKERLPDYMIPSAIVVMEELPLTPNGKLDRRALPVPDGPRQGLDDRYVAPRTASEKMLAEVWEQVLGVGQVGVNDNFFELGGDSILMIQIISRARRAGMQLTLKQVFQHQTVAELAALAPSTQVVDAEQGAVVGPVPVTPAQAWLLEQNLLDPHHFNQSLMLEVRQPVLPKVMEKAVGHLLAHHDALRLRLERQGTGWRQSNAPVEGIGSFSCVDVSSLPEQAQRGAIQAAAEDLQSSLNLFAGPLLRVVLFECGARQPQRLLIVIHHLAIDGVSWRILLEDLQTACQQLGEGAPCDLPVKTTSFKRWAETLGEHARSAELRQELDYWLAEPRTRERRLSLDTVGAVNTVKSVRTLSASLTKEETQSLLQVIPATYHAQINEVLLAALAQTFARWTGRQRILIDLESHGREDIFDNLDLSRTVGWFTAIYPLLLDLGGASEPKEILRLIKEQVRKVPNHGIGYGLLRYMSEDSEVIESLDRLPPAEVIFNYLGQFDNALSGPTSWAWAQESSGPSRSLRQQRRYLFEISGNIAGGQLYLTWKYGEGLHKHSTVQRLLQGFTDALRALIASAAETGGQPAQDFSVIGLSQGKIDNALAELELGE